VCVQVGLSVLLLMASGLFLRTLHNLRSTDVGFNTTHLVTFEVDPALAGYKVENVPALHDRIGQTLSQLPGVVSVGATDSAELAHSTGVTSFRLAGYPSNPDNPNRALIEVVTPTFFQTLEIPLLAGRPFNDQDIAGHPRVRLVNQTFARHFCGTPQACIGRRLGNSEDGSTLDLEIVGVVGDAHHNDLRSEVIPAMYEPFKQQPHETDIQFYVRTVGDPAHSLTLVQQSMHALDPSLSLGGLITLDEQVDRDLQNDRLISLLSAAFGALATALAGVGLYGVVAYSTAQRTREIAIRMALGSTRVAASMLILKDVFLLVGIGVLAAVPVGVALSHLLRSQLYNVSTADPAAIFGAVTLILLVAALSAVVPARRAAGVSPNEALRAD
jgi:putative ABC transport system permease protein